MRRVTYYDHDELEGWSVSGGTGSVSGSRSWSFHHRPEELTTDYGEGPVYGPTTYFGSHSGVYGPASFNESYAGSYSDSYYGRENYDVQTEQWILYAGSGGGSGSVRYNAFRNLDGNSFVCMETQVVYSDGGGISDPTPIACYPQYVIGPYRSHARESRGSDFELEFTVSGGRWVSDHWLTKREYNSTGSNETLVGETLVTRDGNTLQDVLNKFGSIFNENNGVTKYRNGVFVSGESENRQYDRRSSWFVRSIDGENSWAVHQEGKSLKIEKNSTTKTTPNSSQTRYTGAVSGNGSSSSRSEDDNGYNSRWNSTFEGYGIIDRATGTFEITNNRHFWGEPFTLPDYDIYETVSYFDAISWLGAQGTVLPAFEDAYGYHEIVTSTSGGLGISMPAGGPSGVPGINENGLTDSLPAIPPFPLGDWRDSVVPERGILGSAADGLKSGAKGTSNGLAKAGAGFVSLGQWRPEGPFELTELDLAYGAGYSEAIAEVSGEILIGVGTGSLGCVGGKVGKLVKGYDYASNVVQTGTGIVNGDPLQAAAGIAGSIPNRAAKCFTAGTQVVVGLGLTENGEILYDTKNIEDIEVGDLVYSYNTTTGEYGYNEVKATFERNTKSVTQLTILDGHGNEQTIETTESHPFWVVTDEPDLSRAARSVLDEDGIWLYHENVTPTDNGYWVEAKDLREGDTFLGANGELSTLKSSLKVEVAGGVSVFNFEVAGNHNYFVLAKEFELGQSCILVHNNCETVQRWMSKAELEATIETGLLRGGKEGVHYATDAANKSALRARLRSALPQTPEVRVTMEVPENVFSKATRVEAKYGMPGGGLEREATGPIQVKVLKVDGKP